MKPVLSIQDLVKVKTFGTNILITESIAKVEESFVRHYHTDSRKATFRIVRENPNKEGSEQNNIIFLERTNQKENKEFFEKLDQAAYHNHGDIDSDKLKEDLLPLYSAHVQETLGYGEDAELINVSHKSGSRKSSVFFKTTKTYKNYDEYGTVTEEKRVKEHQATWAFLDPAIDYPNIVVIPRNLFSNTIEFLRLFCKAVDVDSSRIHLIQNPTIPGTEKVEVHFNATDLVYSGSLPVTIIPFGEEVTIYNKVTGAPVTPETEGEGGGEDGGGDTDPTDPETNPGDGEGEDGGEGKDPEGNLPTDPEPVILEPKFVSHSVNQSERKLTIETENVKSVEFNHDGITYSSNVTNNVTEFVFENNVALLQGMTLVITLTPSDEKASVKTETITINESDELVSIKPQPSLDDFVIDPQTRTLTIVTEGTMGVGFMHGGELFTKVSEDNVFEFKFEDSVALPSGTVLTLTLTPSDETVQPVAIEITIPEGQGFDVVLPPEPVITDLTFNVETKTVSVNVDNAEEIQILVNDVIVATVSVTDKPITHMLTQEVKNGDIITVEAKGVTASITLEIPRVIPELASWSISPEVRTLTLNTVNTSKVDVVLGSDINADVAVVNNVATIVFKDTQELKEGDTIEVTLHSVDVAEEPVVVELIAKAEDAFSVVPVDPPETDPEGGDDGTVETQTGEPLLDSEGNPIQTEG